VPLDDRLFFHLSDYYYGGFKYCGVLCPGCKVCARPQLSEEELKQLVKDNDTCPGFGGEELPPHSRTHISDNLYHPDNELPDVSDADAQNFGPCTPGQLRQLFGRVLMEAGYDRCEAQRFLRQPAKELTTHSGEKVFRFGHVFSARYNKPECLEHWMREEGLWQDTTQVVFVDDNSDNVFKMFCHFADKRLALLQTSEPTLAPCPPSSSNTASLIASTSPASPVADPRGPPTSPALFMSSEKNALVINPTGDENICGDASSNCDARGNRTSKYDSIESHSDEKADTCRAHVLCCHFTPPFDVAEQVMVDPAVLCAFAQSPPSVTEEVEALIDRDEEAKRPISFVWPEDGSLCRFCHDVGLKVCFSSRRQQQQHLRDHHASLVMLKDGPQKKATTQKNNAKNLENLKLFTPTPPSLVAVGLEMHASLHHKKK
jgi:hypothetical protein